jgi:hypothetical protein
MENTTPKTAEEILMDNVPLSSRHLGLTCSCTDAVRAMKEYARQESLRVALQVRAECAEKAKAGYSQNFGFPYVDKDSILSINLDQFIK